MASSEVSAVTDQWATVEADAVQLMWLGTQVVLRSAFLVAQLQGFRPPAVGGRDRADPWWVQLVELGPWVAGMAGIGLVAGLAASRFMKASSERRYQPSGSVHNGSVSRRGFDEASAHGYSDPASAPISRELQSGEERHGQQ